MDLRTPKPVTNTLIDLSGADMIVGGVVYRNVGVVTL
jgi:hypothetical protein